MKFVFVVHLLGHNFFQYNVLILVTVVSILLERLSASRILESRKTESNDRIDA